MDEIIQKYMEDEDEHAAMDSFHKEMSSEERLEAIVILEKMLWFAPSSSMKRFVRLLLERCEIPTGIRCRMAEQVYDATDPLYIERIREWIARDDMEVACRVEWLQKIHFYPLYTTEQKIHDWMTLVFRHSSIRNDDFYRHRAVMDAYHTLDMDTLVQLMLVYKKEFEDPIMYRILFAQVILRRDLEEPFKEKDVAEEFLYSLLDELMVVVMGGADLYPMEIQADICDFFLNTEFKRISSMYREEAQRTMTRLFTENMTSGLSIFANRQNVHSESIEHSSQEMIEQLHHRYGGCAMGDVFQKVQQWRVEMETWEAFKILGETDQDKIMVAWNRIVFDKRLYGKTGDSLATLLGLVWRHVHVSDHKEELKKRLLEEMMEASGQCSTGIAVRILNTLSGFDDFAIRISPRESILAQVMHILNQKIMALDDTDLQERLLEQMTVPNSEYGKRKDFLEFFRNQVPDLKETLYEKFKTELSDADFDLYLRQALLHYEGSN